MSAAMSGWNRFKEAARLNISLKHILYGFNILTWAVGLSSIAIGIWLYIARAEYSDLTSHTFGAYSAAALFGAAGATIIVVGFVGCCGFWIESRCLLIVYMVLVTLLFVIELTAAVLAFLYKAEVTEVIKQEMYNHLQSRYVTEKARDSKGLRITWNSLHIKFKCCGVENFKDWFKTPNWPSNDWVPDSCCDTSKFHETGSLQNCGRIGKPELWFQRGCYLPFSDWLLEHMQLVGIMGVIFGILQLFALVGSAVLFARILSRFNENKPNVRYQRCGRESKSIVSS